MTAVLEQPTSSVNRINPDAFPVEGLPVFTAFTAITSSETGVTWSRPADTALTASETNPRNGIIRWYEPVTGRWLSNDPIGISGGLNQYVFCGNNPVNYVDPEGTTWTIALPWLGGEAAAGSGALAGLGPAAAVWGAGLAGSAAGHWIDETLGISDWIGKSIGDLITPMKPHTKGARPSTKNKHEDGDARRARDRSGEDGDFNRRPPRRRPDQWKGPWPPKEWNVFPFPPNNPFDDGQSSSCDGK